MDENKSWNRCKMEEDNKEKAINIKRLYRSCTEAGRLAVFPVFGETLLSLA